MIPSLLASHGAKLGVYAALFAATWLHGCITGAKHQEAATEVVRAEYSNFRAQVQAKGEAAQKEADATTARDIANKERTDADYSKAVVALRATNRKLLNARAAGSVLPARPADTRCSETSICFDRAELDAAVRRLDAGISGIVEESAEIKLRLDTGIAWAARL